MKRVQEGVKGLPLRQQAALWLLLLGSFFFASYGGANWFASMQEDVGHIVFDWERHIPFVPWTIIPYWVIDAFYAISLFVCASGFELDRHARRLLTAQVIAVCCFMLFPLQFTFERPLADGLFGGLFAALYSFDQPFNQAPSLHIALLIILWKLYLAHLPRALRLPFHIVCVLIAVSVLTTYQHHFFDIPTGALLGWFCLWLWPDSGVSMLHSAEEEITPRARRMAGWYLLAALAMAVVAVWAGGFALWLFWPAVSLVFVAVFYGVIGSKGFQKDEHGRMSAAVRWLLLPYLIGAWLNSRLWTLRDKPAVHVDFDVWLGRFPSRRDVQRGGYSAVVDLTAELPAPDTNVNWHSVPCLDLLVPSAASLCRAVDMIEKASLRGAGPVLVVCALGYSRSAMAVAAWLLHTNQVRDVDEAISRIRAKRPAVVLSEQHRKALQEIAW